MAQGWPAQVVFSSRYVIIGMVAGWEALVKSFGLYLALTLGLAPAAFAQSLPCPVADGANPSRARKEFVLPYQAGADALQAGRFEDAVLLADAAAPNAVDALQLQAVLTIRSAALMASRDDERLVPTLEARIRVGCFARSGDAESVALQLEAARIRSRTLPDR